eukprot:s1847_g9.t1
MAERSRSPKSDRVGGVFFWRINQAKYRGAGAQAEQLLLSVLERYGVTRQEEPKGAALVWANCFESKLWASAGHCFINHFPRSVELSHKHRLCETLIKANCRHLPPSFILPAQLADFEAALKCAGPAQPGIRQGDAELDGRCRRFLQSACDVFLQRQAIHGKLKARYEDFVVREVSQQGEVVELKEMDLATQWQKSSEPGEVARLVLAKENRDVADAIAMLAKHLEIDPREVRFNGLKDRRSISYQHVSLPWHRLSLPALQRLSVAVSWDPAVQLGDLRREKQHCRLGNLRGNHFTIVLRDVSLDSDLSADVALLEQMHRAAEKLRGDGFVNYFGEQRFGGAMRASPAVGAALLQKDFRRACEVMVCQMHEATASNAQLPALFAAGRFGALRAALPRRCAGERQLLRRLERGEGFEAALGEKQLFFLRSFTSHVWNQVVTRRLQRFGSRVFPEDRVEIDGTEALQLRHVLLPLPDTETGAVPRELPTVVREIYEEVLRETKLDPTSWRFGPPSPSVPWRRLVASPQLVRCRAVAYEEPVERLVLSAMDRVKGRKLDDGILPLDHLSHKNLQDPRFGDLVEGALGPGKAREMAGIIMELQLSSGQYATVAVQEFMQCSPHNAWPKK